MVQTPTLGSYQEAEEDNWDDLVNNNDDLDHVLRTSIYSNKSSTSNNTSPTKSTQLNVNNGPIKKKKPYQSISLADFENAMQNQNFKASMTKTKGSPLKKMINQEEFDTNVTINKNIMDLMDEYEDDGFLTLGRKKNSRHLVDDSDIEDGLEFPDNFNIPKKQQQQSINDKFSLSVLKNAESKSGYYKPDIPNNFYSATLNLSPANSSFSGSISGKFDNSSNSAASVYSESETEATDFNDIEFQNDDFEKLLELRLLRAKHQAELEEKEFYLLQQQKKKNNNKKKSFCQKNGLAANDLMALPDDTFVCPRQNEEIEEFLDDDFEDIEEDLTFAITKDHDRHKNVVIRNKNDMKKQEKLSRSEQLLMNDMNVMKFYNNQLETIGRSKSKSPVRKAYNDSTLIGKKSMPSLRTSSKANNIRKVSSSMFLNGKKIFPEVNRQQIVVGNELDNIDDLVVDYSNENKVLNGEKKSMIDITKYMEVSPSKPRRSILKNSPTKEKYHSNKKTNKKIGLIKHLNNSQKQYIVEGFGGTKMVYNPQTFKWEGNEVDAKRFSTIKPTKQPALITFLNKKTSGNTNYGTVKPIRRKSTKKGIKITKRDDSDFEELSIDGLQVEGNMYFNPRKLCWISLNDDEDSDEDPFKDIHDLEVNTPNLDDFRGESPFKKSYNKPDIEGLSNLINNNLNFSKSHYDFKSSLYKKPSFSPTRGFSNLSTHSSPSKMPGEFEVRQEYQLSSELIYKFRQEEERWNKKVGHWFQPGGDDVDNKEYLYEIRNMVMGNNDK